MDEMESTGNKIRIENKIKAKNVMALAVNFIDDDTLAKIQEVFASLEPHELDNFKTYLDKRHYMTKSFNPRLGDKIINQITRIALYSDPEDEYLNGLYNEYKKNLDIIDDYKIKSSETINIDKVTNCLNQIDAYNERNVALIEKVNEYREKKFNKKIN